jgi:hypothetical protein
MKIGLILLLVMTLIVVIFDSNTKEKNLRIKISEQETTIENYKNILNNNSVIFENNKKYLKISTEFTDLSIFSDGAFLRALKNDTVWISFDYGKTWKITDVKN